MDEIIITMNSSLNYLLITMINHNFMTNISNKKFLPYRFLLISRYQPPYSCTKLRKGEEDEVLEEKAADEGAADEGGRPSSALVISSALGTSSALVVIPSCIAGTGGFSFFGVVEVAQKL